MAVRSAFFNSVSGDRKYNAQRFAEYFATFISNGVFPNPSTNLQVMANNDMTVTVKVGKAWINGYILINDDDYILEIEPADGVLNRIDRIVVRYDTVDREIRLEVKRGDYATNAVAKDLQRDADAYELGLADIEVNAGVISISQSNITDLRMNSELCGIVHGTVEQVDTTTLFNQYLDWYSTNTAQAEADIANIKQQFEDDINQFLQDWQNWYAQTTDQAETDINNIIQQFQDNLAQFNQDWNDWFSNQQTEGFVLAVEKGQPGGIATLAADGKVNDEQLPTAQIGLTEGGISRGLYKLNFALTDSPDDDIVKKYGVQFSGSNPVGVRLDDAVGMVANVAVDDALVRNDFDNVPFYNRPMCNVYFDADGTPFVTAYRGEPGFSFEGAVFPPYTDKAEVYYECLPCAWNGSFDAPSVVGQPCEGYELFECFPDWNTPIYLPSYWMAVVDGKPTSRSGTRPGYYSLNSAMSTAKAWHARAHTETMAARMYEYILQIIEFATRDVQTVMMGCSTLRYNSPDDMAVIAETETSRIVLPNASANTYIVGQTIVIGTVQNGSNVVAERNITAIEVYDASNKALVFDGAPTNIAVGNFVSSRAWKNGATDIVRASSGSPVSNTSQKHPCIWRGKVDPWADGFSLIADILIQRRGAGTPEDPYTYRPYYLPDPSKYANGTITGDYVELEHDIPQADGYAMSLWQDSRYRYLGLTNEVGASSTTYLAAYYQYPRNDVGVVRAGGSFGYGRSCSPVFFFCISAPSTSFVDILARLFVTR